MKKEKIPKIDHNKKIEILEKKPRRRRVFPTTSFQDCFELAE